MEVVVEGEWQWSEGGSVMVEGGREAVKGGRE